MEKIKGKFFFPENFKKKKKHITGTIEIQENGSAHLELLGILIFDDKAPFLFLENKQKVNIWGIAENGSKISLLDCNSVRATQHLGENGMKLETYHARFVLKKAWVKNIEEKYFNKISVSIEGLDLWLNISGGKQTISYNEKKEAETFSYSYKQPDPINFEIENGLKACFYFTFKNRNDRFGYHLQQTTCLELHCKRQQSLSFFLERIYHFAKFLNIVSGSTLGIRFMTMTSFKNNFTINQKTYYEELNLIYLKEDFPFKNINPNHHSFIITYSNVQQDFEEIMRAWFVLKTNEASRIIEILNECIVNKNKVRVYLFLAVTQAAEGFYRIHKGYKNHNFDKIIRILLEENINCITFYDFKMPDDLSSLAKSIKELRNDSTHIGKFPMLKPGQSEIYFFTNLLKNIICIALLKKIGIDESLIKLMY
jgi:hypothetical protein